MPLFGAHMSTAGGYYKAILAAEAQGCETVQVFTKPPNQWAGKPIAAEDAARFRAELRRTRLRRTMAHDSYLINLASPDPALHRRSVEAFVEELDRAELLGLSYLVTHPGAHLDAGEETGLARVAAALDEANARQPGQKVRVLLETTAGMGTSLGHRFEHLGRILATVAEPRRLGVCLDTCHVFAAGYALAPEAEYRATFREFDRQVGLKWLCGFHLNDSLRPAGSRVDRHAHIGRGHLGLEAFRLLVNDPRFKARPMVIELPKEAEESDDMDAVNLSVLRGLVAAPDAE
jgi:deoxyribonuclease IV